MSSQVAWVLRTSFAAGAAPSLLATSTGPAGFALKNAQLPANFSKLHFFTATTGIAVATPASGASTWPLYQTTDGGATWQLLANSPAIASGATTIIQKFAVGNSLWFSTDKGDVLRSSNLGQTWTLTPGLGKVVFEDELHGLAYTSSSSGQQLARTADGGLTWVPLTFSGQPLFTELAAIPGQPGTYLSVGSQQVSGPPTTWPTYNGVTGISHDRGATWTTLAPVNYQFQHVVASATQVWATGIDLPDGIPVGHLLRFTGSVLAAKPRADASLAWYPNPTTGPLQLAGTLPGAVAVRVYNAVGQLCQAGQLAGPAPRLDLSALPAGLYQVVLQAADGSLRTQQVLCAH